MVGFLDATCYSKGFLLDNELFPWLWSCNWSDNYSSPHAWFQTKASVLNRMRSCDWSPEHSSPHAWLFGPGLFPGGVRALLSGRRSDGACGGLPQGAQTRARQLEWTRCHVPSHLAGFLPPHGCLDAMHRPILQVFCLPVVVWMPCTVPCCRFSAIPRFFGCPAY
jgi:hypothetical protein